MYVVCSTHFLIYYATQFGPHKCKKHFVGAGAMHLLASLTIVTNYLLLLILQYRCFIQREKKCVLIFSYIFYTYIAFKYGCIIILILVIGVYYLLYRTIY